MLSAEIQSRFRFLVANGASQELAQLWATHVRPHLAIVRSEAADYDLTLVGASKLGGIPDGPTGSSWPRRSAYPYANQRAEHLPASWQIGGYLPFLGQINLADVTQAGAVLPGLPDSGLLQLFYDTALQPWGFDPADRAGFQLVYIPDGGRLQKLDLPQSEWEITGPVASVTLARGMALPDASWIQGHLIETGWTLERVWDALDHIDDDVRDAIAPSGHQIGGWPSLIQSVIEDQCEFVTNGIYCGGPDGYASDEAKRLRPGAHLWRQVFQIDSDEDLGWDWGSMGRLYAMMREPDISTMEFTKAHLVLQCT